MAAQDLVRAARVDNAPSRMLKLECDATERRAENVGGLAVRRALPTKGLRSVGAWCFIDHMGPDVQSREVH